MTFLASVAPDRDKYPGEPFDSSRCETAFAAGEIQRKTYTDVYVKDINEKERSEKSVITTDGVDRDGEVVLSRGLKFEQFRKNPVVLWMHLLDKVIGKCLWIKEHDGNTIAKTQYAETEFADGIWQLVKGGFLNAKSIGMNCGTLRRRDIEPKDLENRADWAGAKAVIEEAEILEYSVVSVPANPDALMRAEKAGLGHLVKKYFPGAPRITRVPLTPKISRAPAPRIVRAPLTARMLKREVEEQVRIARGIL